MYRTYNTTMSTSKKKRRGKYRLPNIFQSPNGKKYVLGKYLGRGGYADCYKVSSDNFEYAGKFMSKRLMDTTKKSQLVKNEISIHSRLNHPNVVRVMETFVIKPSDDYEEFVVIILELCTETLYDVVKREKKISDKNLRVYLKQIINGLKYIHQKDIIHRDIKPGNILIKDGTVKICDFGMSAYIYSDNCICGTPNYISPEVLNGQIPTFMCDVWSLGVMIYALAIGKAPFETSSVKTTYQRIRDCKYSFPDEINDDLKDMIKKIIQKNPTDRLSLDEISKHHFFTNVTVNNTVNNNGTYFINTIYAKLSKPSLVTTTDYRPPTNWIVRWHLDTNFGLFYEVNNGEFGAIYNDLSIMITQNENITYIRRGMVKGKRWKIETTIDTNKPFTDHDVEKKTILLRRYIKHLPDKMEPFGKITESSDNTYIIKWLKTKYALFLRLDNKTIQVQFYSGSNKNYTDTGIIISSNGDVITYINKNGMSTELLPNITDKRILSRLKYIKGMMKELIDKRHNIEK